MSILRLGLGILLGSWVVLAPMPAQAPMPNRGTVVRPVSQQSTGQESRVALVIGNAAYARSPLRNPVNDARAVAAKLKERGLRWDR